MRSLTLINCQLKIQEKARLKVVASGRRGVHAWITGELLDKLPVHDQLIEIRYNPFISGQFFTRDNQLPVWKARLVVFGTDGRCFISYSM